MADQASENQQTKELLDFQTKLKELNSITGVLSQAASLDDFYRLAVELGRSDLGFDRLGLWLLDNDPQFVVGSFGTDEQGATRDERGKRHLIDPNDLSPEMLDNGERRTLFRNIALHNDQVEVVGYGDALRGNLWDGSRILGWLNADNLIHHEPWSDYQIELLGLYAAALGHLIARKRIEEALRAKEEETRQFQEKLKSLHDVTADLSRTHSFDEMCRCAIELGRSKLGFDRLGLWFLDSDPNFIVGSFGIDESGNVRDERSQRLLVTEGEHVQSLLEGRAYSATRNDVPLYDDEHQIIGIGWKGVAKIWDGNQNIGWLTTDNLFSHKTPQSYQLELLTLYASTIGHLATVRKTEDALTAERNLFRTVIDTVPEHIYVKNLKGEFQLLNKTCWHDDSGYTSESQLLGKTDFDVHPRDHAEQYWQDDQRVMNDGQPIVNKEEPGRPKDGQIPTLLTTKVPLHDGQGHIIGLVGVTRDVTEMKRSQRQAVELAVERERNKVLRESVSNISHDLRTPLSIINTSLYLLEHLADPEKQKVKLDTIKRQTTLLEHFIGQILLSAQLQNAGEIDQSPVNLTVLSTGVIQSLRPIAEKKDVTLISALQPDLPDITGDRVDLERVMINLVQNAITYTPEGGSVIIKSFVQNDKMVAEVADTGIGISPDNLPYIFDNFYRVDKARPMGAGGMGLGLAIVKRIVEMHGGIIEVESVIGGGTTFRVSLPLLNK